MINLGQFHFLRPLWLLALLPLVVLLWLMVKRKLGSRNWETICDEQLLPYILIGTSTGSRRLATVLTAICGIIAILSLAGPVWEKLPQPVFSRQSALVIALDLSRSMDADDITPSRLSRARYKIADILHQRQEGLTALLVYAGDAFTVTPLTDDTATIASQLNALTTAIMPVPGNRTDLAIEHALALLKQAGNKTGDIILLTDEVDLDRSKAKASSLKAAGYRLSVLGIGTEHGVPIPLADGGFLKDSRGKIIIPVLDEKPMRLLAAAGGGRYVKMTMDDRDINSLNKLFASGPGIDGNKVSELETDSWREQGPWLVLLLLPLTALVFRRGYMVILLVFLLPFPHPAHASGWKDLWLRPDQQARRILDEGKQQQAAELFRDPAWKGAAQYLAGDYKGAIESLQDTEAVEEIYNRGNALARLGRYEDAIAAYDKVLSAIPDHEDASYNKELLQEELKKQQQNQQQQSQQERNNQGNQQGERQQEQNQSGTDDQQQSKAQQKRQQDDNNSAAGNPEQQADANNRQAQQQKNGTDDQQQANEQQAQNKQPRHTAEQPDTGQQPMQQLSSSDDVTPDEEQQAIEQWLRRIPDDPAGLLRRKFRYQYQQRQSVTDPDEKTW